MPQPPQYERTIDFTERDGDDTDHPALNQELDAAAQSINALRENLALIQRDDGQLQNGIVGAEQLAPDAFEAVRADLNTAVTEAEQSAQSALTSALTAQGAVASAQQSATLAEQARASSQLNAQLAAQSAQEAATAGATAGAAAAQPFAAAAQQAADDAQASAAAAATFDPASYVPKAGNVTMAGPLSVPAGAGGAQVPRRSEVVGISGDESIGGVKMFTSRPKVPSGATGDEVPQAQEIFGKGQSWQTVTRTSGVTYTNSTDKPIICAVTSKSSSTVGYILGAVDGVTYASSTNHIGSPSDIVMYLLVPPGSTYSFTASNVTSVAVKEYR